MFNIENKIIIKLNKYLLYINKKMKKKIKANQ